MISHTAYVVCTNCGQELGRKLWLSPEVLAVAMRAPLPNCQDCYPTPRSPLPRLGEG